MAGRMPVGQVWIRVSPDTRGFADETRRELKKMKSLDRYKVPIEVEVDTQQIESDFADAIHTLQKRAGTEAYKVKIQTELDWKASDARRQMREQVESYQKLAEDNRVKVKTSLDDESVAGGGYSPTVTLDVDERRFQRDVEQLMDETRANMKVTVDRKAVRQEIREAVDDIGDFFGSLMDRKANILKVEADTKSLQDAELWLMELQKHYSAAVEGERASRRELARTTREYNRIKNNIGAIQTAMERVNAETEEGAEEYEALSKKVDKLAGSLRQLDSERRRLMAFGRTNWLEIETNMESMREAEARVEELRERVNEVGAEITVSTDKTSFAAASAEIWSLTRPRIMNIYANVNRSPAWNRFWSQANSSADKLNGSLLKYSAQIIGLRLMYKTMEDMVRIVPHLDMMIPSLAAGSVAAIAAISAASVALTTGVGIVTDMMRVFNLLLAAPAAAAALGLQAWMLARAYGDYESQIPEIAADLNELGNTLSDSVWETSKDNIEALHASLMPLLDLHMPAWAKEVGNNVGALADGFREATEDGVVDEFFKNAIEGSKNAKNGFEAFGSALLRMTGIGSRVLPDLGNWFSRIMTDFDDWVQRNDANGNMERWIREGAQALSDLGSIVMSTISIFRSFAAVARRLNLPSLTDFARGMASFADAIGRPGGLDKFEGPLENMVAFVREFGRVGDEASLALENLWELAGRVALELKGPVVSAVEAVLRAFNSPKFQEGMMSFFEDIGVFIEEITPGLESLTGEFGSMAEIVGEAAKAWGPAFNELLLMFEDLGSGMHPGLADFLQNTGPELEKLVRDLRPAVEDLGDALGDMLADKDVQEFVSYLLDSLGNILELAIDVGTGLMVAFRGFAAWWNNQPEWFKNLSTDLLVIAAAVGPIAAGLGALKRVFGPLVAVVTALGRALGFLGAAMRGLGGRLLASGLLRGGIGGLLTRILGRGLLLGGGPAGWALLIASIVPADLPALLATYIAEALIPDGWGEGLMETIRKRIREATGGKTIFGIMWEGLKELFAPDSTIGERIWGAVKFLFPPAVLLKAIADGLMEWFAGELEGLEGDTIWQKLRSLWDQTMWPTLRSNLEQMWDRFVDNVMNYEWYTPAGAVGRIIIGIVNAIMGLFGLGDGSADSALSSAFGPNSGTMSELVSKIKDHISRGINWLQDQLSKWNPTSGAGKWIKDFLGRVPGLLGFNDDGSWSLGTMASSWVAFGEKLWREDIKPWLQGEWDKLVEAFKRWKPVAAVIDFLEDPVGTVLKWLGMAAGFIAGAPAILGNWGLQLWNQYILPWLQAGFDALWNLFMGWEPVRGAVEFFKDPVGTALKWLGKDGGGLFAGGVGQAGRDLGNWGRELWDNHLHQWMNDGYTTLEGQFSAWEPSGGGGGGGGSVMPIIRRVLGLTPEGEQGISGGLARILGITTGWGNGTVSVYDQTATLVGESVYGMSATVSGEYGTMQRDVDSKNRALAAEARKAHDDAKHAAMLAAQQANTGVNSEYGKLKTGVESKTTGMKNSVSSNFGSATLSGKTKSAELRDGASGNFSTMRERIAGFMSKIRSKTGSEFDTTSSSGKSKTAGMKDGVVRNFATMQVQATAKAAAMKTRILAQMTDTQSQSIRKAVAMNAGYVRELGRMASNAARVAQAMKNTLLRILNINAGGAGRYTGGTFVSGLSSGLSRARGVAQGIAGGIRRALSFSAYGSGSTVGGTFASGIRSRIGAVSAAASALAAAARRKMPNSPAAEGPFAGSGWGGWGESIADELAKGLRKGAPGVASEAVRMMEGVNSALDARSGATVGVDLERARRNYASAATEEGRYAGGPTIEVNVESRSEDPLQDGNRFGGDILFTLRGAGLA